MPRPTKKRFVCCMPKSERFAPEGEPNGEIALSIDEYEAIRLIDLEGNTQEVCASQMHIARTTIQGIYIDARRKIADALVNGKTLTITGGDYKLCANYARQCGRGCNHQCHRHECNFKEE